MNSTHDFPLIHIVSLYYLVLLRPPQLFFQNFLELRTENVLAPPVPPNCLVINLPTMLQPHTRTLPCISRSGRHHAITARAMTRNPATPALVVSHKWLATGQARPARAVRRPRTKGTDRPRRPSRGGPSQ
jgi:hypothetical protein